MVEDGKLEQTRVLVTGAAGMLGSQVILGVPDGIEVVGTDLIEAPGVDEVGCNLAQQQSVEELFGRQGPFTGVIHAAAYTAVDKAEEEEELALVANRDTCQEVARVCRRASIPLVAVGTDFVFDGTKTEPYREDDPPNPISAYGRTKLAGERVALEEHPDGTRIVRTQWLYGPRGKHFPATMQALARKRDLLRVVADQYGSPTSTLELAPALWDVLMRGEGGIYHAACEGSCTWFDLAVATLEYSGIEGTEIQPCTTEEYPTPAARPAYSVLDCGRLTALRGAPLADWRDALKTYLGNGDQ